ncbi:LOW QUALITY PROTEIN: hypothetical protein CVT25_000100 [Psilocybe cyanescens]|uniref:26S proteasome regulatory subunit Rpn6 N-terminal domain-containing protein n=1 Tax=Psilocybe cyanescens TaxID=93625 RepID=A0A409XQG7_PSICY|nr:LOW QUALITY PROTEIN: hypothetical protein CVT25_000100 [Psilocybe cyanescens]
MTPPYGMNFTKLSRTQGVEYGDSLGEILAQTLFQHERDINPVVIISAYNKGVSLLSPMRALRVHLNSRGAVQADPSEFNQPEWGGVMGPGGGACQSQRALVIKSTLLSRMCIAWMENGAGWRMHAHRYAKGLAEVISRSRVFMSSAAKAKTTKLICTPLDYFAAIPDSRKVQMKALMDDIAWAKLEKRIFLTHSLETRLVGLCVHSLIVIIQFSHFTTRVLPVPARTRAHQYPAHGVQAARHQDDPHRDAPPREPGVLRAGKYALGQGIPNILPHSRQRSLLSAALQVQLDLQSGILHMEEKDYSTAHLRICRRSARARGWMITRDVVGERKALEELKDMLLGKVMLNLPEDVNALLTIKLTLRYASSRDVQSMRAVAGAPEAGRVRVSGGVERVSELQSDPTIRTHLATLYDTLFEGNLKKIVEPYSAVEVAYVAEQVGQELSKKILNKVHYGVLDQGRGPTTQPPTQSTVRPLSKPSWTCSRASSTRRRIIDYSTTYSNFYEAFENLTRRRQFSAHEKTRPALHPLPGHQKHARRRPSASEEGFEGVSRELQPDPTIRTHLAALYGKVFEGNLKIVKPYSVVEAEYIAEQVGQERQAVEANVRGNDADLFFLQTVDDSMACWAGDILSATMNLKPTTYGVSIGHWSRSASLWIRFSSSSLSVVSSDDDG